MLLFVFESIGTSELLLIGVIALIFLGPRKLPQIARTIGRTMADLRSATNEFKSTWEREVDLEKWEEPEPRPDQSVPRTTAIEAAPAPEITAPEVRTIDEESAREILKGRPEEPSESSQPSVSDKRDWL
jgi:Tat protein translocase TatB subunit